MAEETKKDDQNPSEEEMLAQWEDMASEEEDIASGEKDAPPPTGEMGQKILDQDEIDSLLGGPSEKESDPTSGIDVLLSGSVVNYERLPMLDVIFDNFERLLSISLRHFTADNVDLTVDEIKTVRFGDFTDGISLPAGIVVSNAVGLDDYILMTYESSLIYSIVDVLLGGRRAKPVRIEGRGFTPIERRIMDSLSDVVLADLSEAFAYIAPIQFTMERMETNPRFANITREGNACILMRLCVTMEEREGFIDFCLPYGTLEPIREQLLQQFMGEKLGQDNVWTSHLERELYPTTLNAKAVLCDEEFPLKDVLKWRIGDTIMLETARSDEISIKVGGQHKVTGRLGKMGDYKAVQVTRHIGDVNNEEGEM